MTDKTNNNSKPDTDPGVSTDATNAGVTAAGDAENKATLATMLISIHLQGQAARTSLLGEAAKAQATVHD